MDVDGYRNPYEHEERQQGEQGESRDRHGKSRHEPPPRLRRNPRNRRDRHLRLDPGPFAEGIELERWDRHTVTLRVAWRAGSGLGPRCDPLRAPSTGIASTARGPHDSRFFHASEIVLSDRNSPHPPQGGTMAGGKRISLKLSPEQQSQIKQATGKSAEAIELSIEELEERI